MKTRILHTRIYTDDFFAELNPVEKLIFIYLLTNENVNIIHLYELPDRKILYDLGISQTQLTAAKDKFQATGKIYFYKSFIYLANAAKYEQYTGERNETAKEVLFTQLNTEVLAWYNAILNTPSDTPIDRPIDTNPISVSIHSINNKSEIIKKEVVKEKTTDEGKQVVLNSKNSIITCSLEEIQEIANDLHVKLSDVELIHETIKDKIIAGEFKKYKTVYFTLRTWVRNGIQSGRISVIGEQADTGYKNVKESFTW